jgi:hypothetical protein
MKAQRRPTSSSSRRLAVLGAAEARAVETVEKGGESNLKP